ncbi:MAG: peptidoglycan DD-metalloendopeptidase family protein [Gammaproteobacteria bacterium]
MLRKLSIFFCIITSLVACSTETNYAPVTDINTIEHIPKTGVYRVLRHETLYSIAWRYGLDYRYLANRNHIAPPYHVTAGQLIYLNGKPVTTPQQIQPEFIAPPRSVKPHTKPIVYAMPSSKPSANNFVEHESNTPVRYWRWPAHGPVIGTYSSQNKGVNIGGRYHDPIYATAAGQVVYSGNGLRGYGNLIIIKHNNAYLTAYAHNSSVLIREGDQVRAGQKIAEMGNANGQRVILHFEIRRNGQPVNPLNYLAR